MTQGMNAEF